MSEYVHGVLTNSHKMLVALTIIDRTVRQGEKILLFSTSLLTLSLVEDFLREHGSIKMEDGLLEWKRNSTYFREINYIVLSYFVIISRFRWLNKRCRA